MSWHAQPGIQAPVSQPARQPATIADAVAVPAACCRGTWRGSGSGICRAHHDGAAPHPVPRLPACKPGCRCCLAAWPAKMPPLLGKIGRRGFVESTTAGTSQRSAHSRRAIRGSISSSSRRRRIANICNQDASSLSACCYFCLPTSLAQPLPDPTVPTAANSPCPPPVCMPNSCPLQFCLLSASWWPGGGYTVAWKVGSTIKKTNSQNTGAGTTHARTHAGGRARALLSRG